MTKTLKHAVRNSSVSNTQTNVYLRNARAAVSDQTPLSPPYVIGPPLNDRSPLTFGAFIQLQQTKDLFGMRGDVANMLVSLSNQPNFMKASSARRANKTTKAHWKRLLSEHVRRSYLGDRRGIQYWTRIAKVIWVAYENMLRLKVWAHRALDLEEARLRRWQVRAEKERNRQRERRARSKAGLRKRTRA